MTTSNQTLWLALAFVLLRGSLAHAQNPQIRNSDQNAENRESASANKHRGPLVVLSTTVDRVSQTLTIRGSGFGSRAPQVLCETDSMTIVSASIIKSRGRPC